MLRCVISPSVSDRRRRRRRGPYDGDDPDGFMPVTTSSPTLSGTGRLIGVGEDAAIVAEKIA
jgi:hypothetical protein